MNVKRVAISSAHARYVSGASGFLNEVTESRKVVPRVADFLRQADVHPLTFNDDVSRTVTANINAIVSWHNSQTRDVDVSVHFNAFQTTQGPRGTETLHRTQQTLATRVSANIAGVSGLINRGPKVRTDLGFLNRVAKPAILIEVCFVDSRADADLYNKSFDAICRTIAEGIINRSVITNPPPPPTEPTPHPPTIRQGSTNAAAVREAQTLLNKFPTSLNRLEVDGNFGPRTDQRTREFQRTHGLVADGIIGPLTWARLRQT